MLPRYRMKLAAICILTPTLALGLGACNRPPNQNNPDSAVTPNPSASPRHTNRLAREKSPYLLQHAHNPVDWYAWGEEAFARARAENKPIFLSIGYSTCHWCHVMERESFEDEKIGAFLREHFISIKLDREERPDVDKIYMTFVQSTTGSGGWPLNVFLTPERKPFFGGTYFPPDNRYGRGSFISVLQQIAAVWRDEGLTDYALGVLLTDTRGGRQGFPLTIVRELEILCELHVKRAASQRESSVPTLKAA